MSSPCRVPDARGDVFRGLEVVEQACGAGAAMMGETLAGVASGMDTHSYREPLGVCAGEALWMDEGVLGGGGGGRKKSGIEV